MSKGKNKGTAGNPGEKKQRKPRKPPVDDGIPKSHKAAVTRFCKDVVKDPTLGKPGMSAARLRKAVWADKNIVAAVIEHGSLVWRLHGFTSALETLVANLPTVGVRHKRMTDEEKEAYAISRKNAILETAMGAGINEHSLNVLRSAYMQGLKAEEREAAKTNFNRSVASASAPAPAPMQSSTVSAPAQA